MGNNGSFMEKVYLYLPVLMCHAKMDYNDRATVRNIRLAYYIEQVAVFAFTAYFFWTVRRKEDKRKILVPDISQGQLFVNNVPKPEEMMYKESTYFQYEMAEVFSQIQQAFVALMLTVLAHFVLGFKPILLLQIFSTPYHFTENRLFRKHVLGLKPGYRVWGERFEGEVETEQIKGNQAGEDAEGAIAASDEGRAAVASTPANIADEDMPIAEARVAEVTAKPVAMSETVEPDGIPMPRALEDALIDAWDAAEAANWATVKEQLGPLSVNTQTPVGKWTPLMVACGLSQVGGDEVKSLVSDLDALVDLQDEDGWTCMHWAAQRGRAEAARSVFKGIRETASEPSAAANTIAELLAIVDKEGKTAADVVKGGALVEVVAEAFLDVLSEAGQDDVSAGALS